MTKEPSQLDIDPLNDTAEEERAKLAAARTARDGDGTFNVQEQRAHRAEANNQNASSYQNYLFGHAGWTGKPAFSDSVAGRAAIRLVSRGIVGAAFFTLGGHIASKQMKGYTRFGEIDYKQQPLQVIARGIDTVVGNPLQFMARQLTSGSAVDKRKAADEIVTFRMNGFKAKTPSENGTGHNLQGLKQDPANVYGGVNGRSLGEEIVSVTFDFFSASIGDALTRNVIEALDPNVVKPWLIDKDGKASNKGHFDAGKWLQASAKASWRIFSFNAMEDWAAALPYVYQMKWQRGMLSKFKDFKGFEHTADNSLNGGVAKIARLAEGDLRPGDVNGGFQWPGIIDLQLRFTGYNWYTLMYREAVYGGIAKAYKNWKDHDYKIEFHLPHNPVVSVVDSLAQSVRYVAKSAIKATIYMTPAVPTFWLFRTPQSKWRGSYIDQDNFKEVTYKDKFGVDKIYPRAYGENMAPQFLNGERKVFIGGQEHLLTSDASLANNMANIKNPYASGIKRNWYEAILNPFGAASYNTGTGLTKLLDKVSPDGDGVSRVLFQSNLKDLADKYKDLKLPQANKMLDEKLLLRAEREKMARNFVDASFSYTPYMITKAETGLRVNDPFHMMDNAIYRLIDNTLTFKFNESWKALKDITNLSRHMEHEVTSREGKEGVKSGLPTEVLATPGPQTGAPKTKVLADGRTRHDPVSLDRANDNDRADNDSDAPPAERTWAETMAGRKLGAQFQASAGTRH